MVTVVLYILLLVAMETLQVTSLQWHFCNYSNNEAEADNHCGLCEIKQTKFEVAMMPNPKINLVSELHQKRLYRHAKVVEFGPHVTPIQDNI